MSTTCQKLLILSLSIIAVLLPMYTHSSETGNKSVYLINVEGMIDLGLAPYIKRIIEDAQKENASAVILKINTFGGRLDAAVQIRDTLLDSKIMTVAFIDKRAISAGALISLACDKIIMASGGTIGAATPVEMGLDQQTKPVSEKVVSYFRSEMKSTAEKKKRNPQIAEAMVDPDVEIKGLIEKGKLLTLTTVSAIENKIADFQAENVDELLAKLNLTGAQIVESKTNWGELFVRFLTNPIVSSLLMIVGFLGLFLEFKTPGVILPGVIGVTALLFFFFGHYIVNLVGLEEVLIFIAGVGFLIAEIFYLPGFGILAVIGIMLILSSLVLALIDTSVPVSFPNISMAILQVGISLVLTLFSILVILRFFPSSTFGKKLVLADGIRGGIMSSPISPELKALLGKEGVSLTPLHPAGRIVVDGHKLNATSEGDFIDADTKIKIIKVEGMDLIVKKA